MYIFSLTRHPEHMRASKPAGRPIHPDSIRGEKGDGPRQLDATALMDNSPLAPVFAEVRRLLLAGTRTEQNPVTPQKPRCASRLETILKDIDATALEPCPFTLPNDGIPPVLDAGASESQYYNQLYSSNVLGSLLSSSPPVPPNLSIISTATLGRSQVAAQSPTQQSAPPTRQLELSPYSKQEIPALYDFKRGRSELAIALVRIPRRGLRGSQSWGTSGSARKAHGVDEVRLRSSKSSRTPNTTAKAPRKFRQVLLDKPGGGVTKPTWHDPPVAIQARRSANRLNYAPVWLHLFSLYVHFANNISIVAPPD
ncbi:hypothetical protein EDB92DRAFT_1821059 [Lactarius akahatsu]|uniref:Uncharacterized protein n=1 Tax=Lactarius akahatsu TaxID=416441 RepID=A0AAD4L4D3_9AGAM|nr:hypothetical protein EDB92DRAFT_1821059 [Lactarius akahatsu]